MQQQAYNFQFWYIPGEKKKKKESQRRSLFRSTYSQTWLLDALSAKVTEPCQHQCKIIRLPVVTIIICAPEESDQSSWSLCRDWIIGRKLVRCRLIDIFQSGRSAQGFFSDVLLRRRGGKTVGVYCEHRACCMLVWPPFLTELVTSPPAVLPNRLMEGWAHLFGLRASIQMTRLKWPIYIENITYIHSCRLKVLYICIILYVGELIKYM